MAGHGHVYPNKSGSVARCGGPGLCSVCSMELAEKNNRIANIEKTLSNGFVCGKGKLTENDKLKIADILDKWEAGEI